MVGRKPQVTATIRCMFVAGPQRAAPDRKHHAQPRKASKRSFGTIRQMRSGNWQASYSDPYGAKDAKGRTRQHKAPTTFIAHDDAVTWLKGEEKLISWGA